MPRPGVFQRKQAGHGREERQGYVGPKRKTENSGMCGDQQNCGQDDRPSSLGRMVPRHELHPGCQHELEAAHPNRPALDAAQTRLVELRNDVLQIDVTVAVKMRNQARLALWTPEINDQQASLRFQHTANLTQALLTQLSWQMVEHERAQHHIESGVRKRQRFDDGDLEGHVDSRLGRLGPGTRHHRRRRVDTAHLSAFPNLALGDNGQ